MPHWEPGVQVIRHEDPLRRISGAGRIDDVLGIVGARASQRGYDVFAIGAPHRNGDFAGYFHSTWPAPWIDIYIVEGLTEHDPLPAAAAVNLMPFRWSDLIAGRAGMALTGDQRRAFDIGAAHGWREGICVPIHGPGAYLVLGSFAGEAPDTSAEAMAGLHLLTLHAHVRLAALHARQPAAPAEAAGAALSPREIEALACVFSGLTDAGTGRKIGVSERTARFHIDNARRKLGAKTRAQAVAAALAMGLLGP
jgi:DNA-binding CsgD family transcriptional regulator